MKPRSLCRLVMVLVAVSGLSGCELVPPEAVTPERVHLALKAVSPNKAPLELAIIGDSPYGPEQVIDFPNLVAHVNADPYVKTVVHLGDIKNGSTRCDDSYFDTIAGFFAGFADPLIFTPGDNEWTDCHRASNGAYDPLERLAVLRDKFYPEPGQALGGRKKAVIPQSWLPEHAAFVENQMWFESTVAFGVLHVVGSNNGRLPWFGDDTTGTKTDDPTRRLAEVAARTQAALDWLERLFALANHADAQGVVVMMQADTWTGGARDGFTSIIQALADLCRGFGKPVLLLQGDSHVYKTDSPLFEGDAGYGVTQPVTNLVRIVVQGSTSREWLRLRVDPREATLFSWERVLR